MFVRSGNEEQRCSCGRLGWQGYCCRNSPSFANKENMPQRLGSPMKQDMDISLYGNPSPQGSPFSIANRRPLEDHDPNSQDSGYSAGQSDEKFSACSQIRAMSFGSFESMEDEFLDISEIVGENDENAQLPGEFCKLISDPIISAEKKSPDFNFSRPPYRRAVSMVSEGSTPSSSRVRSCLFKPTGSDAVRPFKRPEPPTNGQSPMFSKRSRIFEEQEDDKKEEVVTTLVRPTLMRSVSLNPTTSEDSIKSALQRSSTEPDLIGDFTKAYCLPLISGRHQDLKSISPTTLYNLMQGNYSNSVSSFKVIDCRYPYEFNGGHILGAINLYTKEQILTELLNPQAKEALPPKESEGSKRDILVFHCEFSSERGPNLSRFLRNVDRIHNKESYPYLHYPEIYLLDGGYKSFYEQFSSMCTPIGYLPMLHPEHENDLRHFRAKSKTWNADLKMRSNFRSSHFKRL